MSIHPEIAEDKAWKAGRRIYVRAGYKSQLSDALYGIGAKWDRDEHALWVGSGKLDQVVPLILAQAEVAAAVQAVKELGFWAKIPFDAEPVREAAKKLGARWDRDRKEWAMPSQDALDKVTTLIAARKAAKAAAPKPAAAPKLTAEDVIAQSGRTVTGEQVTISGRLDGHGKRAWAESVMPKPGDVRRMPDGRRMLVLTSSVDFMNSDAIEDFMPGREVGWYFTCRVIEVAPDEAEQAQDAERATQAADGETIAAGFEAARKACQPAEVLDLSPADGPSVTVLSLLGRDDDGKVTLLGDETLIYQHRGYYDDYRRTQGTTNDPEAVAAFRAILAGGSRSRTAGNRTYEIHA